MPNIIDASFQIRTKLGDVSQHQLSENVLLSTLHSTINRLIVELNLSSQNWLLKSTEVTLNGGSRYPISTKDFGTPIMVERNGYNLDSNYRPIEIINANNLSLAAETGKRAVTFYRDGDSNRIQMSFSGIQPEGKVRIWYEPDSPMPKDLEFSIPLQNLFFDYLTVQTALFLIDYVKGMSTETKAGIRASLGQQSAMWANNWDNEINRAKTTSVFVRIPFRSGR